MQCNEVDRLLDSMAADEVPEGAIASHLATCRRCAIARGNAGTIARVLADLPPIHVPPAFTNNVIARIRRERWRSEQVLDWTFNVAVGLGVLLIAGGLLGLAWTMGFVSLGGSLIAVVSEGSPILLTRLAQETQTIALAGGLLTMALALWWWVEGGAAA